MTPDTLIIDRSFPGVGRIKVRTGTTNPKVRAKMNRMLDHLMDSDPPRFDVLRAVREQEITIMEAFDFYRRNAIDQLPIGLPRHLLATSMKEWIESLRPGVDFSAKHLESLETSRRYFERARPGATVAELPALLEELRASSLGLESPRSFNLARSAAMAFLRAKLKKSHPLYTGVVAVERRRQPKTTKRSPLSPEQMRNFFPAPETDGLDAIAWGMASTGMGAGEYYGDWSLLPDRVHVEGTKREGRRRDVPLVIAPTVPTFNRRKFEDDLRERTNRQITVYDLRRTYANWLESASIPRTRRKMYLGHGASDVTDLYERHEIASNLAEDGAKLREFLSIPHTVSHTITLHKEGGTR